MKVWEKIRSTQIDLTLPGEPGDHDHAGEKI